jgi:hypothetical protein
MIDDGTVYDSNNIPLDKIHPFSVRSWNHAIKATALNSKGYTNG